MTMKNLQSNKFQLGCQGEMRSSENTLKTNKTVHIYQKMHSCISKFPSSI